GKRAVSWGLVDAVYPTSQFKDAVHRRARELAATSDRPEAGPGITLSAPDPTVAGSTITYSAVSIALDRGKRTAALTVHAPRDPQPSTPNDILKAGDHIGREP